MQQPFSATPPPPSKNWVRWVLPGCVIPILLALCIVMGVVGVLMVSPSTLEPVLAVLGLAGKARAAAYVPEHAPLFVSLDVDIQQAANLQTVWGALQKNLPAQANQDDIRKRFSDQFGCDFQTDIAPWWGPDAAFFLTDAANLTSAATSTRATPAPPPNWVVAIGTRDAGKSQVALQRCATKQQAKSEETYKNNKITLYGSDGAAAVVGSYVLFASNANALHAAVDAARGDVKSLDKNDSYRNLLGRLPANRVGTLFMQFAPFVDALSQSQTGTQRQALAQLQAFQGVAMALGFEPTGARLDFITTYDSATLPACNRQLLATMSSQNQTLQAVPANTLVYWSSVNLKGTWDCSLAQMDATARRQFDDSLASLKKMNVDFDADVMSLLTGEYAVAVTPSEPLSRGMPGVGGLLLIEAKDRSLMAAKVDKLTVALGAAGVRCSEQSIKELPMKVCRTGMTSTATAPTAGYGLVNNFMVIAAPTAVLTDAVAASQNPLANDIAFQAVKRVLPAKNSGYFYVNVPGLDGLVAEYLSSSQSKTYQKDVQPWLKAIRAVGWASDSSKAGSVSGTLFIYIPGN